MNYGNQGTSSEEGPVASLLKSLSGGLITSNNVNVVMIGLSVVLLFLAFWMMKPDSQPVTENSGYEYDDLAIGEP